MADIEHHYQRIGNLDRIYKVRGLEDPEIKSFLTGVDLSEHVKPGSRTLEIGCGAGNFLADLKDKFGAECYGIDKFPILTDRTSSLNIMRGDAENIPIENNFFDFAFSYFTFPYIPDKLKALSEVYRVLKPSGTAIIDFDRLDVDRNNDTRLVDRHIFPTLDHIMDVYIMNRGRVQLDRVNIFDKKGNQIRRSRRVFLKKTDDKPLHFPALKNFQTNHEYGFPTAMSFY